MIVFLVRRGPSPHRKDEVITTRYIPCAPPQVSDPESAVSVEFTPTIPHCSMATLIGLSIKVKLIRSLPERFKVDVHITPGTHASEHAVNKQLADKERVAAALENMHLLQVVNQCLSGRS
ncbi:cytosolic iron-sulfur assembly component 2B-like [Ahaetulla prasina]|uniref:cytosolic iron-sulfur assembly component 2B-like n=1 Tax=Ahaetulla prasina TaxID=499056 RepID=UPI00264A3954|nr:cytosolic iron-sulfur assembly component 2B-like [Ahaetulla prasina]